jgi:NADH:ubiquinone oxidoreductase subunit D
VNLQAIPLLMRGGSVSDAITTVSTVDPVLGEVDR